jgi:hypothetical protein
VQTGQITVFPQDSFEQKCDKFGCSNKLQQEKEK